MGKNRICFLNNNSQIFVKKYKNISIFATLTQRVEYFCYSSNDKYLTLNEKELGKKEILNDFSEIEFLIDLEKSTNKKYLERSDAEFKISLRVYDVYINNIFKAFEKYRFCSIKELKDFINKDSSIEYLENIYQKIKNKNRLDIKFLFLFKGDE